MSRPERKTAEIGFLLEPTGRSADLPINWGYRMRWVWASPANVADGSPNAPAHEEQTTPCRQIFSREEQIIRRDVNVVHENQDVRM